MSDTNEPSPRPWRVEENVVGWHSFIVDANGDGVAACWRTARGDDEKERQYNEANAALIVNAVNHMDYDLSIRFELNDARAEIDSLRDIVRRMMEKLAVLNAGYRLMLSEGPEDAEMADLCTRTEALVREARAAIGEGAR